MASIVGVHIIMSRFTRWTLFYMCACDAINIYICTSSIYACWQSSCSLLEFHLRSCCIHVEELAWFALWFVHWTFRTLHETEDNVGGKRHLSRVKFFMIALVCSFCWHLFPGYFFQSLQSISWVCWAFPNSVAAHQIGSGLNGLGVGALTLDWTAVASFLFSPLICPFFAIANVFVGYAFIIYVVIPVAYWGLNLYNAKTFPIFSSHLYTAQGPEYNITLIVNDKFELDLASYKQHGRIHMSTFFALTYGFGFATIAATLTHVALFYGR